MFFEMPLHGLAHFALVNFFKTKLPGFITVFFESALANDLARAGLNNRHGEYFPVLVKNLSHSNFLSDKTDHCLTPGICFDFGVNTGSETKLLQSIGSLLRGIHNLD